MQSVMHHRNTFYTFFAVNLLQKTASKHFLGTRSEVQPTISAAAATPILAGCFTN